MCGRAGGERAAIRARWRARCGRRLDGMAESSKLHKMIVMTLGQFSTCEVSDALIKLGVLNGGHIPDIVMMSPPNDFGQPLCAPAYTVKMVLASDAAAPRLTHHFVDTAPAGSFIVIDGPARSVLSPPQHVPPIANRIFGL